MIKVLKIFSLLALLTEMGMLSHAQSAPVVFTQAELNAAFTLVRPELNELSLEGSQFIVKPAPALKFFGLNETRIDINMNEILEAVALQFHSVKSRSIFVRFMDQGLELRIPLSDQKDALRSRLGNLSIKGVALAAVFGIKESSNQKPLLYLKKVQIDGVFAGTGVLKPKWVIKNLTRVLEKVLRGYLGELVSKNETQENIYKGFLGWGKFYTGEDVQIILPGSTRINEMGIQFEVN